MDNQADSKLPPRAIRFPLGMPLRYREAGEANWHVGKVENISRTGVLFDVENVIGVNARLEMTFELPVELGNATPGQVYCEGEVVRTVLPVATDRPLAVAAQIQRYRLMPKGSLPEM